MRWVRPIISLMAMSAMTIGFFMKMVSAEVYVPIATGAIVWWYVNRDKGKLPPNPPKP